MKLLVICPTLSDKGLAASYRLIHVLNYFLKNKIFTTVYVSDPDISRLLMQKIYSDYLKVIIVEDNNQKNIFVRLFRRLFGVPDSFIFWGNKVKKEIFKNHTYDDFDAIFISSPPHSLQVTGMQIAKYFKIPHFTDFRDDWTGSHRMRHITSLHAYLSEKNEQSVLENSKLITHAIPYVAKEWKEIFQNVSDKIYPLSNGYAADILNYRENSKTIKYPKNTIIYFGGDYKGFVVEKFTELRNKLIQLGLAENWMIVTGGPFEIPFKNDDTWVHYGNIPQTQVYDYIYNANIHISLLPPGDLFPSRTIPIKLYTQVTTRGTCVFIGNDGATTQLFSNIEGIFFMGKDGWETLAKWIKENEAELSEAKYKRKNIDKFNFDNISKQLLTYMQKNLR